MKLNNKLFIVYINKKLRQKIIDLIDLYIIVNKKNINNH